MYLPMIYSHKITFTITYGVVLPSVNPFNLFTVSTEIPDIIFRLNEI